MTIPSPPRLRRSPFSVLFGVTFCLIHLSASLSAASDATASEVASEIANSVKELDSLYVKTRVQNSAVSDDSRKMEALFGTTSLDDYAFASGGRLFRLNRNWTGDTARGDRAWMEERLAFDGKIMRGLSVTQQAQKPPETVAANIEFGLKTAKMASGNIYNEAVGCLFFSKEHLDIWRLFVVIHGEDPTDAAKAQRPFAVVDALASGRYSRLGGPERVGSVMCIVFDNPDGDRLWLASELGNAVVRREWRVQPNGPVTMSIENADFEKVTEHVWLPRKVIRTVSAPESGKKSLASARNEVVVTDFVVNSVRDNLFTLEFPAGTRVIDSTRVTKPDTGKPLGLAYSVGKDDAATQRALDEATDRFARVTGGSGGKRTAVIVGIAVAAVLAITWLLYRRRRVGIAGK